MRLADQPARHNITVFRVPPLTPFVKKLLIASFSVYVLGLILQNFVGVPSFELLALSPDRIGLHTVWQLFTYVLAWPPGPNHVFGVLLSLLFLWWVLAPFESRFGTRRTAQLTLAATVLAAIPAIAVGQFFAGGPPLFGTNAILLASIAAFAWSLRGHGTLSFFGVLPMKPVHLIFVCLGLSLLFFLASRNFVELVADLSAVGTGILFVEWASRPSRPKRKRSGRAQRGSFRVVQGGQDGDSSHWLN